MRNGRQTTTLSYTHGKWAASDDAWCDLMDRAQAVNQRSDVVDALLRCLRRCHTRLWPADHWSEQRKRWTGSYRGAKVPAFQVSERELCDLTGLSRQRVRTAMRVAEEEGLIVRLAAPAPRGEGRGTVPSTHTFACYLSSSTGEPRPKASGERKREGDEVVASKALASKWGIQGENP